MKLGLMGNAMSYSDSKLVHDSLLSIGEVCQRVNLGKTKIYELIKQGMFPPKKLMPVRRALWRESDVDEWIRRNSEEALGA